MKDMNKIETIDSQIEEILELVCEKLDEVPDKTIQWSASPDDKENAQIVYLAWLKWKLFVKKVQNGLSNFVEGC